MSARLPSLTDTPRAFPLPTISEDTLHYTLHLPSSTATAQRDVDADAAALATLISSYVQSLLPANFLWNKDAWELKVESPVKLGGTMRVGDAVDDEWLVVWLLREVSKHWPEIIISIRDSDGEFLLIEAAHELPAWVAPENAENRLWLAGGHLHLVPLSISSEAASRPKQMSDENYDDSGHAFDPNAWVSEKDALDAVRTDRYRADEKMESVVWERISSYPEALKTHQQLTKAYLPVPIARALKESPELIQRAVEGFYVRDPSQLRAAARMNHFPPSPAVLAPVTMTRAAYAQLSSQVFHPPRIFGAEWHVPDGDENQNERRWRDLGVKIATGFEIMYREGGRKGRTADTEPSLDDLKADPEYQRYIADLRKACFFGNEVEGSALWKTRETEAANGWIKAKSSDSIQQRQSFAYLVDHAIEKSAAIPTAELETSKDCPEDSDKWLEVDPQQIDAMLMRAAGGKKPDPAAPAEVGEEDGRALKDLASKVQEFVGGQGDLQGAQFAHEISDDDMDTDSESDDEPEITEAQRQERMSKLVPGLSAEEWGRKPQEKSDVDMGSGPTPSSGGKGLVAGTELGDSLLPPKMRPPIFAKQQFDGVESDSSDDDNDLPAQGSLGRRIAEMKWGDGEESRREARIEEINDDDDGDEEDKADRARAENLKFDDDEVDRLMRQRVWGDGAEDDGEGDQDEDMDVDMDDEQEEFLKFSREALGISDEMWDNILQQRRDRGAFVPEPKGKKADKLLASPQPTTKPQSEQTQREPNTALDSFESMMAAMESELERSRQSQAATSSSSSAAPAKVPFIKKASSATKPTKPKPKSKFTSLASLPTEADLDDMDDDDLAAMDAELRAALEGAGDDFDDDDVPEASQLDEAGQREYRMMRDLLESAHSQGGEAGAAAALLGRLGEQGKKK